MDYTQVFGHITLEHIIAVIRIAFIIMLLIMMVMFLSVRLKIMGKTK